MTDTTAQPAKRSAFRRFIVRAMIFQLILVLFIVVAHAVWSWRAAGALAEAITQVESRGEPMTVAALQPQIPPPDQNGYAELIQAAAIVDADTAAGQAFDEMLELAQHPLREDKRAIILPYLAEREAALPLLDQAAAKPVCVSDRTLESPLILMVLPELVQYRGVARYLRAEAMVRIDEGDHATAVKRLQQIAVPASAAASHQSIVGHLVATGCRANEADALVQIAPDLKIGNQAGAVSEAELTKLIASLMDSSRINAEQLRAYQGERVMQVDALQTVGLDTGAKDKDGRPPEPSPVRRYIWQPYIDANSLGCVEAMTAFLPLLASPDWPTARAGITTWEAKHAPTNPSRTRLVSSIMARSLARSSEAKYRLLTDRHLAATALAVRWYRVANGGAWPASLEALVPKYLPQVPLDPMSTGATLRYRAGESPILWSVGSNGTDEGGDESITADRDGDWQRPDRVVHLVVQPRPFPEDSLEQ